MNFFEVPGQAAAAYMFKHSHRRDFVKPAVQVAVVPEMYGNLVLDIFAASRFVCKFKLAFTQRATLCDSPEM